MIKVKATETFTPLQVLLKEDFEAKGYDDDNDCEYDDYPYEGILEFCNEY